MPKAGAHPWRRIGRKRKDASDGCPNKGGPAKDSFP